MKTTETSKPDKFPPRNVDKHQENRVLGINLYSPDSHNDEAVTPSKNDIYGPQLPKTNSNDEKTSALNSYGPQLPVKNLDDEKVPTTNIYGPQFPQTNTMNKYGLDQDSSTDETSKIKSYGPQLPKHLVKLKQMEDTDEEENNDDIDKTDDIIGPLPAHLTRSNTTLQALDERAELLKSCFRSKTADDSNEPVKRESWMTELPPENTHIFGMGPRKFKANSNEKKCDRSLWTDTPNRKREQKTINEPDSFETSLIEKRNEAMDEIVKRSKKHKKETKPLLEIHREKLTKKQKDDEKEGGTERRPFDRDVDLKVNRFDAAQKRSIISKAKLLDSRFHAGRSKYL